MNPTIPLRRSSTRGSLTFESLEQRLALATCHTVPNTFPPTLDLANAASVPVIDVTESFFTQWPFGLSRVGVNGIMAADLGKYTFDFDLSYTQDEPGAAQLRVGLGVSYSTNYDDIVSALYSVSPGTRHFSITANLAADASYFGWNSLNWLHIWVGNKYDPDPPYTPDPPYANGAHWEISNVHITAQLCPRLLLSGVGWRYDGASLLGAHATIQTRPYRDANPNIWGLGFPYGINHPAEDVPPILLPDNVNVEWHWARGPTLADVLGPAIGSMSIPQRPKLICTIVIPPDCNNSWGVEDVFVPIETLDDAPQSATYLLFVADPDDRVYWFGETSGTVYVQAIEIPRAFDVATRSFENIPSSNQFALHYAVSDPFGQSTTTTGTVAFYWSRTPSFSGVIGSPFHTAPLELSVGEHGPIVVTATNRPSSARYVYVWIDRNNQLDEASEGNNALVVAIPDPNIVSVVAVNASDIKPFRWQPPEEGGGFVFSYRINNPFTDQLPDTTIDFYWAIGPTVSNRIADERANTALRKAPGEHSVVVRHSDLLPGHRSPPNSDPATLLPATNLVMVIDPEFLEPGKVRESNEFDNAGALYIVPLVVNIATHGWNSSGGAWAAWGHVLSELPGEDSILDGRVATYISHWESDGFVVLPPMPKGPFTDAFIALALSKIFETPGLPWGLQMAVVFRDIAKSLAQFSAANAVAAAKRIAKDIQERYLLPPDESNRLQEIHLVGHSRGAAVNSDISRILSDAGYQIDQFTSLDGFSKDFCGDGGLIGDILITSAVADRKVNHRVMDGLALALASAIADSVPLPLFLFPDGQLPEWARTALTAWLGDVKAPRRNLFGFEDTLITIPNTGSALWTENNDPTHHMNITERYMLSATSDNYPDSRAFVLDNFVGWNRFAGTGSAGTELPPNSFVQNDATVGCIGAPAPSTAPAPATGDGDEFYGVHDGSFEAVASLLALAAELGGATTQDPFINYWLQTLADEGYLLSSSWQHGGDIQLRQDPGNSFVELSGEGSFIQQFVALPDRANGLVFDVTPTIVGEGQLEVTFAGQTVGTVALANAGISQHVTLPLTGISAQSGDLVFRLIASSDAPATIRLDNIAITTTPSGDLDGDSLITRADLAILARNFGTTSGAAPASGDLNGDGRVGLTDLAAFREAFGTPSAPSPAAATGAARSVTRRPHSSHVRLESPAPALTTTVNRRSRPARPANIALPPTAVDIALNSRVSPIARRAQARSR